LLFRPHPRDREWRARFAVALSEPHAAVQEPSFTDLETLAVLLQHCNAVVTNAGTILLDALANDRPAICTLWDEGAPPGESWALKNVSGEHYKPLFDSNAFYRATGFQEVVDGIERALVRPDELAAERARVVRQVLGEIDGRAADRVADAIAAVVA
jgi:CDP-glycerol glycerophosphotransferase (TagB/SpsB family)